MARIRRAGIDVGTAASMAELVDECHNEAAESDRAREVVDGLLAAASSDPDAAVCALVALRPALLRIARRTCRGEPDDDELAEVVAIAWEEICGPAGSLGVSHVVRATWTRSRSTLRRREVRSSRVALRADVSECREQGVDADAWNDATLASAIADGVVSQADAVLIALTRLGGLKIAELAAERGVPVATLTSRRRRAEAKIRRRLTGPTPR